MSMFGKLFGDAGSRTIKAFEPTVSKINALEASVSGLTAEQLKERTQDLRERIEDGETLDEILPEAFALVREAAKRTLGQRHFDVQLVGGITLHGGKIAEMKTGEGKTLVATLPAYLNALEGKGVHVVTVNDYLSRRDAVWMGQVYAALGLSVGVINHDTSYLYDPTHRENQNAKIPSRPMMGIGLGKDQNDTAKSQNEGNEKEDEVDKKRDEVGAFKVMYEFLRPCTRREAYAADITYGTNNEYGFDYLRDHIEHDPERLRQRDFHFAIVDEIDSILIDEARTPLIISAPAAESENLYDIFAKVAAKLEKEIDFTVDEKFHAATLTDEGIQKAEKILGVENIYTDKGIKYVHHLETAVRAKALYHLDKEYVVRDGEVIIVDEFTGRLQPGRRWSEGLHQAIEAKEGVPVQRETRTYASITFQNYFRLYKKLGGMTGTALTSAEEFLKVYRLDTVSIPTNREMVRADRNDLIFQTENGKFTAIARRVKELHAKGQPVLVGTVSIEKNEALAGHLAKEGIPHVLLNAKNHEREGEIIAQAGRKGAVTIATNMAGRGVDIKLGGNPATPEEYEGVKALGGLYVLGTERHEARRIDNQLRGRSGRQGDPGESQFFVSLTDNLMRVFASDTIKKLMGRFGIPEDEPIENRVITRSLEAAQTKIEGFHFDARKHVLEYDDVLNLQRKSIYERRTKILVGAAEEVEALLKETIGDDEKLSKLMEEKKAALGVEEFLKVVRRLFLQTIDMFWMDHLETMDYLRSSVRLRAYGQRDPLVEYKKEGLQLFRSMETSIDEQIISMLPNIGVNAFAKEEAEAKRVQQRIALVGGAASSVSAPAKSKTSAQSEPKIGRNDPCPCGSGKKYKQCGLINAPQHGNK